MGKAGRSRGGKGKEASGSAEAPAAKNLRVTRRSSKMMQCASSILAEEGGKMVLMGTNDAPSHFSDPSEIPLSNELVNPPVGSLSCSDHDALPEQKDMSGPASHSQNENSEIHPVIPNVAHLFTDNSPGDEDKPSTVEGYTVRPEHAPVLKLIFAKHGNIAENSDLQSPDLIPHYLEMVCSLILTLQQSNFRELTSFAVARMLGKIQDLEKVKFNVRWLRSKLENIKELKKLDNEFSDLKEEEVKIKKQKQLLESCEADLVALQDEVLLFRHEVKEMTDRYEKGTQKYEKMKHIIDKAYEKDLVDGLL